MRIAVLLHDYDHIALDDNYLQAVIIDLDENRGFGIEHDYVNLNDVDQMCLWVMSKEIEMVFIPEDNLEVEEAIVSMGIIVKKHSELDREGIVKLFF